MGVAGACCSMSEMASMRRTALSRGSESRDSFPQQLQVLSVKALHLCPETTAGLLCDLSHPAQGLAQINEPQSSEIGKGDGTSQGLAAISDAEAVLHFGPQNWNLLPPFRRCLSRSATSSAGYESFAAETSYLDQIRRKFDMLSSDSGHGQETSLWHLRNTRPES